MAQRDSRTRGTKGTSRRGAWVVVTTLGLVAALGQASQVQAASEVHLVAAGDFGARAATDTVLRQMKSAAPDAALALGDLSYRDAVPETAWCAFVKARTGEGFPFELLSGNHDSLDVHDGDINNFSSCLPNQVPGAVGVYGREYYVDLPTGAPLVRLINASPSLTFEDGKWSYSQGDAHYTWVATAIDAARAQGIKWVVVAAHIPCLSVGGYSCPSNRDFYDLLLSKKVDLVLHGHEHGYMRTHQLAAGTPGCPQLAVGSFVPACVADSDGTFVQGRGTVFATVGTGGTPLRDVNPADTEAPYFAALSGLNVNASYGFLDIRASDARLSARFATTSGVGVDDSFTVEVGAPPPPNQPPVARITSTTSGLSVTVDGSSSTDPDGTITRYDWAFGDGVTATGATPPPHIYATSGTYPVSLTVIDDLGGSATTTTVVTVSNPTTTLAQDTFDRTQSIGWGSSPTGGAWTVNTPTSTSVAAGKGLISNAAGKGRNAFLRSVSSTASRVALTLSPDKMASGSGLYVTVVGRSVIGGGDYGAKLRMRTDGKLELSLVRVVGGVEATVAPAVVVPNFAYTPNSQIRVRTEVVGLSPTMLRATVWDASQAEPMAWQLSASDATSGLQAPGSIGLSTYYSSTATNSPLTLSVDDLLAVAPA